MSSDRYAYVVKFNLCVSSVSFNPWPPCNQIKGQMVVLATVEIVDRLVQMTVGEDRGTTEAEAELVKDEVAEVHPI